MQQISSLLPKNNTASTYSEEEYLSYQIKTHNEYVGDLKGYDCPDCLNRGYVACEKDGECVLKQCKCMEIRKSTERLEKSGLKNLMEIYTFDKYIPSEAWQTQAKALAKRFVGNHKGKWLYAGGQVGCGKTHLCTAIVGELLGMGLPAKYMLWRDEIVQIKASVMDDTEYGNLINPLKTVKVLYIDDFFKTEKGKSPTTAEINIAFEIINYRYNNPDLFTIISSEYLIEGLLDIDEAVGSRIYQRTKDYCLCVDKNQDKNYRLKG